VLERLFQLYPKMFGARFLPLKLGVFHEIMERHPEDFKKDELKAALGLHARSTRYLEAVASGEKRHDLDANPVDDVAPEHVHHAIMEVFRRRQARSKEDLRPWLRSRLVRAIEASGLARDEYMERVHAPDDVAQAALGEAFAELAERAAKNEALRRAFAASGRSMEEFAEMYGMDLRTVRAALA
jgi:sRNA-binding protein